MSEEESKPEMAPGVIGWSEVVTSDKGASVEFYSKLFGWTSEDMEMPGGQTYTMFKNGEKPVAGCIVPPAGSEAPSMWMTYVNVVDIDASTAKAKELGATICVERVDLPMGSFVVLADPQGATFAFWQMGEEC